MPTTIQVVFDCADPAALARFWAEALGYEIPGPPEGFATWQDWLKEQGVPEEDWNLAAAVEDPEGTRPRIYFQRVPEGKVAKNRVHLDLSVSGGRGAPQEERMRRIIAEAERLVELGASRLTDVQERFGSNWIVMQDPERNEFCVQ
jgi:glyoxalase superfamily protein